MWKKILAGTVLTLMIGSAIAAGVRVKTVDTEGVGETREDAVKAALAEAVARVNGLKLSANDQARLIASSETKSTDRSETIKMSAEEKLQHEVSTATEGTIRSYQVIAVEPDSANNKLLRAKLSVDVNYFQPGEETNRMRIAVVPFEVDRADKTLWERVQKVIKNEPKAEDEKFLESLGYGTVNYLTGTRRFAVLDRDFEGARLKELSALMRPDVRLEERARIGNSLGTDYIVTGHLTDFAMKEFIQKVPYTNEVRKQRTVDVTIQWRAIEAATGQVVLSNTLTKTVKNAPSLSKLADEIGKSIGIEIADAIYPIAVIAYERGELLLGQGGNSVCVGSVYKLVRNGALRYDPYTKEQIGRDEIEVGKVRISRVTPKMAYAQIVSSTEELNGLAPREYILRPILETTRQAAATAGQRRSNQPAW